MARVARRAAAHARARRGAGRVHRPPRMPTTSSCSAWAARAWPRRCSAARSAATGSTSSTRRTRRRSGAWRRARPRSDAVRRRLEVGNDARDALAPRLLLGAGRQARRAVRGDHRPGLGARAARPRARLPGGLLRRADDRRPVLRALAVRARARRADGGRLAGCSTGPRRCSNACRVDGGQSRPRARSRARARRGEDGRDKVLIEPNPSRVRAVGGAASRRVDREGGPRPRSGPGGVAARAPTASSARYSSTTRTTSARSSSAGSSRPRSQARFSGSTRSTSRTCRRPRTEPARFSLRRKSRRVEPESSVDELLAQAQRRRLRRDPGVRRPGGGGAAAAARDARAARRAARHHRARAALPALDGPAAQGRRRRRAGSSRSSTTPARSCRSRAGSSGSAG